MQTPPSDAPMRFCQLILQEDLLGGWTLIRQTGFVGQRGRQYRDFFDDVEAANEALMDQRQRHRDRGFEVMFTKGDQRP